MTLSANLVAAIGDKQQRPILKLEIAWNGSEYVDETSYVLEATGIESIDQDTGSLQPAEANFTLDNLDNRFTAENTQSPIYPFIQGAFLDVRAKVSLGYYYAGQENFRQIGVFVVRELEPLEQGRVATLRLTDISSRFANIPTFYGPTANTDMTSVFESLAEKAGLGTAAYATQGTAFGTAQFAAAVGGRLADELGLLALAEGGRIYVNNGGTLVFVDNPTREAELQTPLITLNKDTFPFDIAITRNTSQAINRVTLAYEDRASAVSDETVWQITTPIKIPAAIEATGSVGTYYIPGQVTISLNAQDQTRWVEYTPVSWASGTANPSSAVANAASDGSGSAVTMEAGTPAARLTLDNKLYYDMTLGGTATGDGNRGEITFRNMNSVPVYVRTFTLVGKPARLSSPYAVQADDGDGQDLLGQILEQTISDPYLPSVDEAYQRALDLLYFRSVRRVRVAIPSAPGVPIKAGEVFAVLDSEKNATYLQQVATINWSFNAQNGYQCSIDGLPSLPGPTSVLVTDLIGGVTDSITLGEPTGPWYWAPAGVGESELTWDSNTFWGPLPDPTRIGNEVGAVSDTITTSVTQALVWETGYWDQQVWG
jgi:hypothetical protein